MVITSLDRFVELGHRVANLREAFQKSRTESDHIQKELTAAEKELESVMAHLRGKDVPDRDRSSNPVSAMHENSMSQRIVTLLCSDPTKEFSAKAVFLGLNQEFPLPSIRTALVRLAEKEMRIDHPKRGHYRAKAPTQDGELYLASSGGHLAQQKSRR